MKKSITLAALLIALGTSVFAAVPAIEKADKASNEISFSSLKSDKGFAVKISKQEAGKSFVMIYDKQGNLLFKDYMTKKTEVEKGYNLSELEVGDYTVKVTSNNETVTKQIHVYVEGDSKSYFFYE
jgi:hypothetical protein